MPGDDVILADTVAVGQDVVISCYGTQVCVHNKE